MRTYVCTYVRPRPTARLRMREIGIPHISNVYVIYARSKGALKRKSLNVEECGHEIRNEFHWSKNSRGTQAIIIATQDRTSYAAVTYERSAGSDAILRLVQLLCGSTITRSVRDEELATWEETRGCARRI